MIILWIFVVLAATTICFFRVPKHGVDELSPKYEFEKNIDPSKQTPRQIQSFILVNENNTILNKFVICLSLQENMRTSLRTRRKYSQSYHAVQGLQVISVCLVLFGNVFFLIMPYLGSFLLLLEIKN